MSSTTVKRRSSWSRRRRSAAGRSLFCELHFRQVAFPTAGDEVAVGIILQLDQRDDMVEAAGKGSKPVQAIKATAAFSQMDGAAQSWMFQEVEFLESVAANGTQGASRNWTWGCGGNLLGQADLHHVACFAAFHEAQDTAGDEAAHGPAHGVVG